MMLLITQLRMSFRKVQLSQCSPAPPLLYGMFSLQTWVIGPRVGGPIWDSFWRRIRPLLATVRQKILLLSRPPGSFRKGHTILAGALLLSPTSRGITISM